MIIQMIPQARLSYLYFYCRKSLPTTQKWIYRTMSQYTIYLSWVLIKIGFSSITCFSRLRRKLLFYSFIAFSVSGWLKLSCSRNTENFFISSFRLTHSKSKGLFLLSVMLDTSIYKTKCERLYLVDSVGVESNFTSIFLYYNDTQRSILLVHL